MSVWRRKRYRQQDFLRSLSLAAGRPKAFIRSWRVRMTRFGRGCRGTRSIFFGVMSVMFHPITPTATTAWCKKPCCQRHLFRQSMYIGSKARIQTPVRRHRNMSKSYINSSGWARGNCPSLIWSCWGWAQMGTPPLSSRGPTPSSSKGATWSPPGSRSSTPIGSR